MGANFIDHIRIECRSGKGGAGSRHMRREKYIPKGGPDGGDGGRGGHIILRGNPQLWTLLHLRYTKHVIAKDGESGGASQCSGSMGEDRIIEVPLGGEPIKYEIDKASGALFVDRFLYTPMRYPGNYGFIPHTLCGDGDPLDVLVMNSRPLVPGYPRD